MEIPLNAASTTAGALFSGGRFRVPEFQREYAWERDEVEEFFSDLAGALSDETYFLGLVILTGGGAVKDVVDGQQRLLTITLLTSALNQEAILFGRSALAERIQSTFLRFIDFESDDELPRLQLSGQSDNETLGLILEAPAAKIDAARESASDMSALLVAAYRQLSSSLSSDLAKDPFKRLGLWADFVTNKLYLATFVHPDPASAYRVFEVVNTRGKELTTADLLKSYVLSQTKASDRENRYLDWQYISQHFPSDNQNLFVQFIRHAVTTVRGHVLPRDLYDVLTGRGAGSPKRRMSPDALMDLLNRQLPLYLQMMDPTISGPASELQLKAFSVLNRLNVIAVRPMLLAMASATDSEDGTLELLKLVVRRVVVGNLGTGAVERRFGVAAQAIATNGSWYASLEGLSDLNPAPEDFEAQAARRSVNRNVLTVLRQSVLQESVLPDPGGYLYFVKPRDSDGPGSEDDRFPFWASTLGNTFLAQVARRPMGSSSWNGFLRDLLPWGVDGENAVEFSAHSSWGVDQIIGAGAELAAEATNIWYP